MAAHETGLNPAGYATEIPAPKRTLAECEEIMTAPGAMHEWEMQTIEGRTMRVFKNTPPSMRLFWMAMAAQWADREYVILGKERCTFRQINERAIAISNMLVKKYGCKKGDKVSIIMRNTPDWVATFWAIHLFGGVATAVNCWLSVEGLVHCLKITDSVVAIMDGERSAQLASEVDKLQKMGCKTLLVSQAKPPKGMLALDDVLKPYNKASGPPEADVKPEDDCSIFMTSGTTGFPKAVLSTQRMLLTNLLTLAVASKRAALRQGLNPPPPSPDDPVRICLLPIPLFHVTGCSSLLMLVTASGGKVVFMHKWSKKEGMRLFREEKVTVSGGVPFIAQEILEAGSDEDLSRLESLTYGGAPAQEGLPRLHAKRKANGIITQQYGLSETNAVIVGHGGYDYAKRPLSTGLPAIVNEIKIMTPEGKEVPTGEIGEICVKGPNVFKCYYNDPKATAAALSKDGWFKSGDLGSLDEEGFLYIRDRAKDIIIRGGENIAATAVENALYRNPVVQDCAVVGVKDDKLGELVAAVVVLRSTVKGVTESAIIEDSKKHLPRHSVPVMVMIRANADADPELRIERNPNGKIVKNQLKKVVDQEWQRRNKAKL